MFYFLQATAALRNLADTGSSRERLLGCQVIEALCLIIDSFNSDGDLMLNISRIFRSERVYLTFNVLVPMLWSFILSTVRKIRNQWIFKINPIELKPTISEFIVLALLLTTVLWKKTIKNIPVNVSTLPRTLMLKHALLLFFTARWPYTRTAARPWLTTPPPTDPLSASSRNISTSRSVYYTQTCVCSFK